MDCSRNYHLLLVWAIDSLGKVCRIDELSGLLLLHQFSLIRMVGRL